MTAAGATLSSANPPPLQIRTIKEDHSGRLEEYQSPTAVYVPGRRVWEVDAPIDAAFPCATQAGFLQAFSSCCPALLGYPLLRGGKCIAPVNTAFPAPCYLR